MKISTNTRKWLFGINAVSAWLGLGMSVVLETLGLVKPEPPKTPIPTSQFAYYGHYADGIAGAPARLIDLFSYFTIWSQVVVGVVATFLFLNISRDGKWFRVFRLDSVLMIAVTGIVYNAMIAPSYPPVGLYVYSSFCEHTLTPILTILVFLIAGPRGWINLKTFGLALLLPVAYAAYTLLRGAVINMYPYDFLDVVTYGYAAVLQFVAIILTAAAVLMAIFWAIDRWLPNNQTQGHPEFPLP